MSANVTRSASRGAERFEQLAQRWPEAANLFAPFAQRIDDVGDRLPRALMQRTAHARADLAEVAPRLQARLLSERVSRAREKLAALWRLADLAHPERPLQRGFVRVTDRAGKTIIHASAARAAVAVDLHFADGRVAAHIGDGVAPMPFRPAKRVERKDTSSYRPGQPGLFDNED